MKKRTITIREDQDAYVQRENLNLSRFVRDCLDERMGPTELEKAYRRTAERDRRVYEDCEGTSREVK